MRRWPPAPTTLLLRLGVCAGRGGGIRLCSQTFRMVETEPSEPRERRHPRCIQAVCRKCCSLGRGCREGNGTPLQYSCLESPMDRGAWWAAVHGIAKSRTRLSDFTLTFHFHTLEKEMASHSSVLAWRIPGTGEPGGLPSMESHRVGHD